MANMNVNIRIDEQLKAEADELFDDLGLSFTAAVNVFVRQAVREGGIPFEVTRVPKAERAQTPDSYVAESDDEDDFDDDDWV